MGVVFMLGPKRLWKMLLEKVELGNCYANGRVYFVGSDQKDVHTEMEGNGLILVLHTHLMVAKRHNSSLPWYIVRGG
jgi:hypothetical protein